MIFITGTIILCQSGGKLKKVETRCEKVQMIYERISKSKTACMN